MHPGKPFSQIPLNANYYAIPTQMGLNPYFSQSTIEEATNFTQIIKSNMEQKFSKFPEQFSSFVSEKIKSKLEENSKKFEEFKTDISNVGVKCQSELKKKEEIFGKIRNSINQIEETTKNLLESQEEFWSNQIQNVKVKSSAEDEKLSQISLVRQNEKILAKYADDVEILKFQVGEVIEFIESEVTPNLELGAESMNEMKNLVVDKLVEIRDEVKKINLEEENAINADSEENIMTKTKAKIPTIISKLDKIKESVNKFNTNKSITGIAKDNFSFISAKRKIGFVNVDKKLTGIDLGEGFKGFKKRKFANYEFFN